MATDSSIGLGLDLGGLGRGRVLECGEVVLGVERRDRAANRRP